MNCEAPFSSLVPCPDRCYGPVQRMLGRMPRLSSPGQTHRSLQDGSGVTLPKNLSKKKRWQVCVCIRAGRTGESSPGTAVYNEGMSERQSDHLHVQESPRLDRATLVLALTGWMDGGDVSTGTVQRLVDLLGARPIATIDPEPFYLYNFPGPMELVALFRPNVRIEEGRIVALDMPSNTFYCHEPANLVFFLGKEPNLHWRAFGECVLELAHR